jgi:hypothetical protein
MILFCVSLDHSSATISPSLLSKRLKLAIPEGYDGDKGRSKGVEEDKPAEGDRCRCIEPVQRRALQPLCAQSGGLGKRAVLTNSWYFFAKHLTTRGENLLKQKIGTWIAPGGAASPHRQQECFPQRQALCPDPTIQINNSYCNTSTHNSKELIISNSKKKPHIT